MSVSEREVPAHHAEITQDAVESIWGAVLSYYRMGLQPAMSLCVRVRGHVVLDRTVGHRLGNAPDDSPSAPLIPATPETPFNLFSASKPITAMIVHGLIERGLLKLDDPISRYLHEFDQAGKRDITLRHVLDRAGLERYPAPSTSTGSMTTTTSVACLRPRRWRAKAAVIQPIMPSRVATSCGRSCER